MSFKRKSMTDIKGYIPQPKIEKCKRCGYILGQDGVEVVGISEELRNIWRAIDRKQDMDYSDERG